MDNTEAFQQRAVLLGPYNQLIQNDESVRKITNLWVDGVQHLNTTAKATGPADWTFSLETICNPLFLSPCISFRMLYSRQAFCSDKIGTHTHTTSEHLPPMAAILAAHLQQGNRSLRWCAWRL